MKKLVWFLLLASAFAQNNEGGYSVSQGLYSGDVGGVCKTITVHVGQGRAALSDGTTFTTPGGSSVTISSTTSTTFGYIDTGGNVSSSTAASVPAGDYPLFKSDPAGFCTVKVTSLATDIFFGGSGGGGGSVNSATAPSSLFNTPINPVGLVLNFSFINTFPGNEVFGVCTAGSNTPGPCSITAAMLPASITSNTSGTAAGLSANIAESQVTNLVTDLGDLAFKGGLGNSFQDVTEVAAPANPSAGNDRIYADSTSHFLACLNSAGGNCFPAGPFSGLTGSTNTTAAMVVGTGASLSATGSGSITATAIPWTGITSLPSSCTNQAVTGLGATLTCNTITSAYTDTSIAKTGTDINTSNQVIATHLSASLPIAQGGTAGTTSTTAFNNIAPAATRAGDIIYNNGTNWVSLAGNNSGTNFLQENSTGVPSWSATAASVAWSGISAAAADTTIPNGNFNTTFTQSAAKNWFWANTTAATSTVNQPSPIFNLCGQAWEGLTPSNTQDCWNIQNFFGNGANPTPVLNFTYGGASTSSPLVEFPGAIATQGAFSTALAGASGGGFALTEGTAPTSGTVGADVVWAGQTQHRLMMNNNNIGAVQIVASGADINTSDQVTAVHLTSAPTACTNQALTALSTTLASTCNTITSAYVDGTVAVTNATNVYTGGPQDFNAQVLTAQVANDTVTGTTAALLGKMTSTGFIKAGTTDTAVQTYICVSGCTTSGNAKYAIGGQTTCTMDATASNTEGFIVIASTTTAGECHALVPPLAPTSGTWVVGTLKSNSTTLGSTATVAVNPFFVNPTGAGGGGTSVSVNGGTTLTTANLSNSSPAAGNGNVNVTFQSAAGNVSAEVPAGLNVFNVVSYGADPTNTNDSLAAVESAMTAACATSPSGAIVFFPPGSYKFSAQIPTTSTLWCSGLTLLGAGVRTTQLNFSSGSGAAINVATVTGGIRNVTIQGLLINIATTTTLGGIAISTGSGAGNGAFNFTLRDIYVLAPNTSTALGISTCTSGGTGCAANGTFFNFDNVRVDGFGGTNGYGFEMQLGSTGDQFYCRFCYSDNAYNGFHTNGWFITLLQDSAVDNSTHEGFWFAPNGAAAGTNTVIGNGLSAESNTGNAYFFNGGGNVILTNPKVQSHNGASGSVYPFEISSFTGDIKLNYPVTISTGGSSTASLDITGTSPHAVTVEGGAQFLDKGFDSAANTYLNQFQGNIVSNGNGGLGVVPLGTPGTPTVTCAGACAGGTWGYKIVGFDAVGNPTAASAQGTATNATTLTSVNKNTITWNPLPGAVTYNVYRTASAGTPANLSLLCTGETIGNVLSCVDDGSVNTATATPSATNLTNELLMSGTTSGNTALVAAAAASGTLTLPAATDTLVGRATTDTLTNKSIAGSEINSGTVPAAQMPTVNTVADTSSPVSVSSTLAAEFHFNQNATAGTAVTYNLPTAAAGKQFCFSNGNNGSAADTGILTIATSATGQFITFTDGTQSATGGNVTSGGAAADAACVVGVDSTHWMLYVQRGSWTKH